MNIYGVVILLRHGKGEEMLQHLLYGPYHICQFIDVSDLCRSLPATLRRSRMKTGFPHTAHTSPRRPKAVAEAAEAGRADLAGEAGALPPPGVRLALAAVVAAVVATGGQFNRLFQPPTFGLH